MIGTLKSISKDPLLPRGLTRPLRSKVDKSIISIDPPGEWQRDQPIGGRWWFTEIEYVRGPPTFKCPELRPPGAKMGRFFFSISNFPSLQKFVTCSMATAKTGLSPILPPSPLSGVTMFHPRLEYL